MDKVFVTGANGFVGLNIVECLLSAGYEVHAYVRPNSNTKYLERFPVNIIRGQLNDEHALRKGMTGCRYVIHTAGNTSCYKSDMPALVETNVKGTESVINASKKMPIDRLVFTSTTSTIGARNQKGFSSTEEHPLDGFRSKSPYARTKLQAEALVLDAQATGNIECVILNLAEVVGAYDHNLQWGRLVLAVHHDQVPFIPPGGGSYCSAKNAAQAHVNALTHGKTGERYIISGEDHDFSTFISTVSKKMKKRISVSNSKYHWLKLNASLYEKFPWLYKEKPLVDPYRMRVFGGHYYFSAKKAQLELGYHSEDLDSMLEDSIGWYRANGYLQ